MMFAYDLHSLSNRARNRQVSAYSFANHAQHPLLTFKLHLPATVVDLPKFPAPQMEQLE